MELCFGRSAASNAFSSLRLGPSASFDKVLRGVGRDRVGRPCQSLHTSDCFDSIPFRDDELRSLWPRDVFIFSVVFSILLFGIQL